jgi:Tfp pilus assembly protein PilP
MRNIFFILLATHGSIQGDAASVAKPPESEDSTLYSSFGKRDPFRAPERGTLIRGQGEVSPIRKYRLESYHLRAILRIGNRPQAMFEDPDGKSHVVLEGEFIGIEGAKVSRIVNSEVIVTEKGANHLGKETLLEKVISLPSDAESRAGKRAVDSATVQQEFPAQGNAPKASPGSPSEAARAVPPGNAAVPQVNPQSESIGSIKLEK